MNTYEDMVKFYEHVQKELEAFEATVSYGGGWGFGYSFDRRSVFASDDARDAYLDHCRRCRGHHDPRGIKHSKCPDLDPTWFATDVAQDPQ